MQEYVEQQTVAVSVKAAKLTSRALAAALKKTLAEMEKQRRAARTPHGRQSVKKLMNHYGAKNAIKLVGAPKDFDRIAREYHVDNIYIKGAFSKINIRRSTLKNISNNISENYFVNKEKKNIFFQKEQLNYDNLPRSLEGQKIIADFFVIISVVEDVGSCNIVTDSYWLSKFLYSDASKFVTGNAMPLFYNDSFVSIYFPSIDT